VTQLPPDLRARILAAAADEPSPPRERVKRSSVVAMALALVALTSALFATGGLHLGSRPAAYVAVTAIGWAAAAVLATVFAFGRGRSAVGRASPLLMASAVAVAPLLCVWALAWTMAWPELDLGEGGWAAHLTCFAMATVVGLAPLLLLAFVRRGTDPVHPGAAGAALGAAAGAWAGTVMDLHCAVSGAFHVAFAHACPSLLLAVIGAVVGARILGIPTKAP
jgi:hypothetical protein